MRSPRLSFCVLCLVACQATFAFGRADDWRSHRHADLLPRDERSANYRPGELAVFCDRDFKVRTFANVLSLEDAKAVLEKQFCPIEQSQTINALGTRMYDRPHVDLLTGVSGGGADPVGPPGVDNDDGSIKVYGRSPAMQASTCSVGLNATNQTLELFKDGKSFIFTFGNLQPQGYYLTDISYQQGLQPRQSCLN